MQGASGFCWDGGEKPSAAQALKKGMDVFHPPTHVFPSACSPIPEQSGPS